MKLSALRLGIYLLAWAFAYHDGASGGSAPGVTADAGRAPLVQDSHSWFTVDGEKFFPIYVWQQAPTSSSVDFHKRLGVNTFMGNGWSPKADHNDQLLGLLQDHDMYAILDFDPAIIRHPRLIAWKIGDEPILNGVPFAQFQASYDAIRTADPERPVVVNFSAGFYWDSTFGSPAKEDQYQQFTVVPEIVSFDMYPVTGWNQPTWVYLPGVMTELMKEHYVEGEKPVWTIVEASDQNLSWTAPETPGPTPEQMRFEVWDSIIHGATGIGYFTISFNPFTFIDLSPAIQQEMTRTNRQILDLKDVILSASPTLQVSAIETNDLAFNYTVRRDAASDTYYLFVDNADMSCQAATIAFTFVDAPLHVEVYGENRVIPPKEKTFTDSFEPLEVHIYRVTF